MALDDAASSHKSYDQSSFSCNDIFSDSRRYVTIVIARHQITRCTWIECALTAMSVHVIGETATVSITLRTILTDVRFETHIRIHFERMFRFETVLRIWRRRKIGWICTNTACTFDDERWFGSSSFGSDFVRMFVIEQVRVLIECATALTLPTFLIWSIDIVEPEYVRSIDTCVFFHVIFEFAHVMKCIVTFRTHIWLHYIVHAFVCLQRRYVIECKTTIRTFEIGEAVVVCHAVVIGVWWSFGGCDRCNSFGWYFRLKSWTWWLFTEA